MYHHSPILLLSFIASVATAGGSFSSYRGRLGLQMLVPSRASPPCNPAADFPALSRSPPSARKQAVSPSSRPATSIQTESSPRHFSRSDLSMMPSCVFSPLPVPCPKLVWRDSFASHSISASSTLHQPRKSLSRPSASMTSYKAPMYLALPFPSLLCAVELLLHY